jgi:hypothetical protein
MTRFDDGCPPGPGRPPGCRNKSTVWLESLGREETEGLVRNVAERASAGDMRAASIVLARTWPRRRGSPVRLDLPPVGDAAGLIAAQTALLAAVAAGEVTPEEAQSISALLENQRRAIETHDFARRLEALERGRSTDLLPSPEELNR